MQPRVRQVDGITIDYTRSSIEIFNAIRQLKDSNSLYLKFSKNHIKTMALQSHAELSLDFDLCLIDRMMNETIIQLFAIFTVTDHQKPVNEWKYVQKGIEFARSLLTDEIREKELKDKSGELVVVPEFTLNPESINFSF